MKSLGKKDIEHVAHLARLPLHDDEIDLYKEQLSDVLNFVNELELVDTSNVVSTSQTTGLVNVLRSDEIIAADILPVDTTISQADTIHNNLFIVPALLSKPSDS